jgi:hypothetical protein
MANATLGVNHTPQVEESDIADSPSPHSTLTSVQSPQRRNVPNLPKILPPKRLSLFRSPSSPNLRIEYDITYPPTSPISLTRSKTLPKGGDRNLELGEIMAGTEALSKMRRWILAFIIGELRRRA